MAKLRCSVALILLGLVVAASTKDLLFKSSGYSKGSRLGIYKGKPTTIKKHPYLVSIQSGGLFACAGSIIGDSWVLTVGDCVYTTTPKWLTVIAGSEDGSSGGNKYNVTQVILHPNYGSDFLDYDFALLQIKGKFKWSDKVKKAKLPKTAAKVGSKTVIVGWGSEGEDATLKQGTQTVISQAACKKLYEGYDIDFTSRLICLFNKGKVSPCQGDLGDPITQKNVLHAMFIDIAAYGMCSKDAYPTIGAKVKSAVPWIQNVTGITAY